MKFFCLMLPVLAAALSFSIPAFAQKPIAAYVVVSFKNTSLLPKKFSIITYAPSETGNNAVSNYFIPGIAQSFTLEEGTKVYLASRKQVSTVMSGQRIDNEKPFLVVKKSDNGKTFALR